MEDLARRLVTLQASFGIRQPPSRMLGRSAAAFEIMIAAHADALGATLVTKDPAIKNLAIDVLKIVSW